MKNSIKNKAYLALAALGLNCLVGCSDGKVFSDRLKYGGFNQKKAKQSAEQLYDNGESNLFAYNNGISQILNTPAKGYDSWEGIEKDGQATIDSLVTAFKKYPNTKAGEMAKNDYKNIPLNPWLQDAGKDSLLELIGPYVLRIDEKEGGEFREIGKYTRLAPIQIKYTIINKKTGEKFKDEVDLNETKTTPSYFMDRHGIKY